MISIIGTSLKKLRDDAHQASLSPDGSQIVFLDANTRQIWIMASDGSQAKPLFKPDDGFHVIGPTWFPNGKRIAYWKFQSASVSNDLALESRNLQGTDPVVLVHDPNLVDFSWAQSGRMIYSLSEPPPHRYDSNLWELNYDLESGKPNGAVRRLTDWTGFFFVDPSMTADGKHLVFLNQKQQSAVYLGELASDGNELKTPQRLTLNENLNWPGGWSLDGKTLFFYSDRDGSFDIYKQGPNDRNAQAIATGPEEKWAPQISPDGKWVLYLQWPKAANSATTPGKLMRAPIAGGAPETVMEVTGKVSLSSDPVSTLSRNPSFRCPARPGADCVIKEKREKQIIFSAIDPEKGRKAELLKITADQDLTGWDLSPDGARVAIGKFSYKNGEVEILPLDGSTPQQLSTMPWTEIVGVAWAADGKSLFLASYSSRGTAIVHTDFAGHAKMLFKPSWDIYTLQASPDGKYLAFGPVITNANAWTMGSFPAK